MKKERKIDSVDYNKNKIKKWRAKNPEKVKEQRRRQWVNKKERLKKEREGTDYWKIIHKKRKERDERNGKKRVVSEATKKKRNVRHKNRIKSDPNYKLRVALYTRLQRCVKKEQKSGKTIKLLGCSVENLKKIFESMFTEGMTWEKVLNGEIHIDHIIPCSIFDLSKPEAQRICFHHTNLQPLWASDNLKKHNFISMEDLLKIDRNLLNEKYLKKIEKYEEKLKNK